MRSFFLHYFTSLTSPSLVKESTIGTRIRPLHYFDQRHLFRTCCSDVLQQLYPTPTPTPTRLRPQYQQPYYQNRHHTKQHHRLFSTRSDDEKVVITKKSTTATTATQPENPPPKTNSNYHKSYQLSGTGTKSHVIINTDTNHTIQTDVPKSMGGTNKAPQPVETLLASWMGCTQATAIFVGRNMNPKVYIEKIEFVDICAYRDERGALGGIFPLDGVDGLTLPDVPARLEKVDGVVKIFAMDRKNRRKGQGKEIHDERGIEKMILSEEQLHILEKQSERRCPVANMMVMSGCKMNLKWING